MHRTRVARHRRLDCASPERGDSPDWARPHEGSPLTAHTACGDPFLLGRRKELRVARLHLLGADRLDRMNNEPLVPERIAHGTATLAVALPQPHERLTYHGSPVLN